MFIYFKKPIVLSVLLTIAETGTFSMLISITIRHKVIVLVIIAYLDRDSATNAGKCKMHVFINIISTMLCYGQMDTRYA